MNNETPTPRTDVASFPVLTNELDYDVVDCNFARQLERELTAAQRRIAELEEKISAQRKEIDHLNVEANRADIVLGVAAETETKSNKQIEFLEDTLAKVRQTLQHAQESTPTKKTNEPRK